MTAALATEGQIAASDLDSIRRWARRNLWGMLLFFLLMIAVLPSGISEAEQVLDVSVVIATPLYTALGLMLVLALYRAFRAARPTLALATLSSGLAALLVGIVASGLYVIGGPSADDLAIAAGTALTGLEFVVMGSLLRSVRVSPRNLWLVGVLAGVGVSGTALDPASVSDFVALVVLVLALLFPYFLYRLSKISLVHDVALAAP